MTKTIATFAALGLALAATTAHAQMQVSYPGDASMSCEQISAEMIRLDQTMGVSNNAIASAEAGARGAETAASLGVNAALYSGALGRVPGLGMFANAAASAAKASAAAKAQRAAQDIQVAQQRRAVMGGMYQGKCGAAAVTAVSATMTTTSASATAPNLLATTQEVTLRGSAAPTGAVVGKVKAGATIYPTGQRNGVWMEVDDENGARGWMSSAFAKPK